MQDGQLPPSMDGITGPSEVPTVVQKSHTAPAAEAPTAPVAKKPSLGFAIDKPLLFTLIGIAVYMVIVALFWVMFPTADGSLGTMKLLGSLFFALVALATLLFGIAGFMRIASVKGNPRMQRGALLRLLAIVLPVLALSGGVLFQINRTPTLILDILEPTTSDQLIAPLNVTFSTDTALNVLSKQGLVPLKYQWDFNNDGQFDQDTFDPSVTYLFRKEGIYNIVARITMTSGMTRNVIRRLVIPRSSFAVDPMDPVIDEPARFSLDHLFTKGSDPAMPTLVKAKWDFDGDGTIDLESDALSASFTYHRLGPVTADVTVQLGNQTQTSLRRTLQVVEPTPTPFPITMVSEPTTLIGPPPFAALFTLNTSEPIAAATWTFGDETRQSSDGSVPATQGLKVAHVFNQVGTYTVTALVRSQSGSLATLSKVVRVTQPLALPDLSFEGTEVRNNTVEGQVPLSIDITPITNQPLITFTWDAPGATLVTSTDKVVRAVYREVGKYFVDLIGIDPEQRVMRRRLTVNVLPAASTVSFTMDPATPTAPALVTFDASDTFVNPGEEIAGFEWDFGDGGDDTTKFTGARNQHQYENPGTFTITLSVRTTEGKVYTGRQTLVVKAPLFSACFIPSRRTGKAPMGVRFDAECSTGSFESWKWDFGDGSQSDEKSPTHVYLNPGEYTVTVTGTSTDGQKSSRQTTISVSAS